VRLNLLVLRTDKLDDVKAFYSTFGASFVSERHGSGPNHYSARLGDLVLEIYPTPAGILPDPSLRIGLVVDDLPGALRAIGQAVTPRQTQWGMRAVVRDPDGRAVELSQA
jgi:lactoylglutathione lyase